MELGLCLTSRCNAACTHCSSNCGPLRTDALTKRDLFRLIDEAAGIDDGRSLQIDLTGGEPFLDFELLSAVVAHAAEHGARVSCMTNAYWARSQEFADERLTKLQRLGLSSLGVSVSRFHQSFIALPRVRRVLNAAAKLGLSTELKAAVTRSDLVPDGLVAEWKKHLDADFINVFAVLPQLREGATLPESEYCREPGLPLQICPGAFVYVESQGIASSCGNACTSTHFLELGSVHELPVSVIHQRFLSRGKQTILREQGPIRFALGAIAAGLGSRLREAYAGPCDLCLHIATDPELRRVADELSTAVDQNIPIEKFLRSTNAV